LDLGIMAVAVAAAFTPVLAQDEGRPQDGFYSGQSNGQVDSRWMAAPTATKVFRPALQRCRQVQQDL
jgi:hypothetical protein